MTNSPGTKLKFRLPMATSPGWALFGTLAFCIAWNGIVAAFVAMAVRSYFAGKPDWLLTLFDRPVRGDRSLGDRRFWCGNCWSPPASGRRWSKSPIIRCAPAGSIACSCRSRDG